MYRIVLSLCMLASVVGAGQREKEMTVSTSTDLYIRLVVAALFAITMFLQPVSADLEEINQLDVEKVSQLKSDNMTLWQAECAAHWILTKDNSYTMLGNQKWCFYVQIIFCVYGFHFFVAKEIAKPEKTRSPKNNEAPKK